MINLEREAKILEILKRNYFVTVSGLAELCYVTEATIRRDLTRLEKNGMVRRYHGGASLAYKNSDVPLSIRESEDFNIKNLLGERCAKLAKPGNTLFMDCSSTCAAIVPHLPNNIQLRVITYGIKTALALSDRRINTFIAGGSILDNNHFATGYYAENMLRDFYADICFISTYGLSNDGRICGPDIESIQLRQMMAKNAKRVVLVLASSKIGSDFFYTYGTIEDVDEVICDKALPNNLIQRIGNNRRHHYINKLL